MKVERRYNNPCLIPGHPSKWLKVKKGAIGCFLGQRGNMLLSMGGQFYMRGKIGFYNRLEPVGVGV